MKKDFKVSVLCLLLLVAFLLTSCELSIPKLTFGTTGKAESTTGDAAPEQPGGEDPTPPDKLALAKGGKTDYTVIFSLGATSWKHELVLWFYNTFQEITGAELAIRDDFEAEDEPETLRTKREIVIGMGTTREDSFAYDASQFDKGYCNFVADERLVLLGGSQAGLYLGICQFFKDAFGVDVSKDERPKESLDCVVEKSYSAMEYISNPAFYFMEQDIGKYRILVDSSDAMQIRMAYVLQSSIRASTGQLLPLSGDAPTEGAAEIVMVTDRVMQKGTWSLKIENNRFTICAGDYYGFTGVASYFEAGESHGFYPQFCEGFTAAHCYTDHLQTFTGSTAYAYNQTGDVRVMFYNVLFNNPLPAERNVLNAELVAQYMPDVLGLQEVNNTKRGQAGDQDIAKLLEQLGYAETIDPRVKNAYSTSKTIPGTTQKGYGTSGATKVKVNGETYYTYYNQTPLFYNTNTTSYLDGGYYWYRNQKDGENQSNCGASDCASKALTWGVFEDKETGERYIVISTHMCTRSEGVRGLQAQEVLALLDEILQTYDYPVFLGGDYNGTFSSINFKTFEEGGLLDIGKENLPEAYNGAMGTMHTAPSASTDPLTNRDYVTNNGGYMSGYSQSVDHIMLTNGKTTRIKVFGVVVDEYAGAGSDHLPIFVDFSFS